MCPASISRGLPLGFTTPTELPCTSALTSSAKRLTSSRHKRAGAVSNPDGPGASSKRFRKSNVDFVIDPSGQSVPQSVPDSSTAHQPRKQLRCVNQARAGTGSIGVAVEKLDAPGEQRPSVGIGDRRELLARTGHVESAQGDNDQ